MEDIESYLHDMRTGLSGIFYTDLFATFGSQAHIKQVSDNFRAQYGQPLTEPDFEMTTEKAYELLQGKIDNEKDLV